MPWEPRSDTFLLAGFNESVLRWAGLSGSGRGEAESRKWAGLTAQLPVLAPPPFPGRFVAEGDAATMLARVEAGPAHYGLAPPTAPPPARETALAPPLPLPVIG